jgi:phosphoribosylformylglycinamidine synthase
MAEDTRVYHVGVRVTLRPAVLDTQGQAILRGLYALEFSTIEEVNAGKYFRLAIRAMDEAAALAVAYRACERLLANPVIETFSVALEGTT